MDNDCLGRQEGVVGWMMGCIGGCWELAGKVGFSPEQCRPCNLKPAELLLWFTQTVINPINEKRGSKDIKRYLINEL